VGNQQLRNKVSYANNIRSKGWSNKWGIHAIQQCRHNAYLCWRDMHSFNTGREEGCTKWSEQGAGSSKIIWAFQVGLIKDLLAHARQYKHSINTRSKSKFESTDDVEVEHKIVNRGDKFKNIRCAVCSCVSQEEKKSKGIQNKPERNIGRASMWCPHIHCRAHASKTHRKEVHRLTASGENLSKCHKISRIFYTQKHPGKQKKQRDQVDLQHRGMWLYLKYISNINIRLTY